MRTAALDIIKGAMRLCNALPSGSPPSGEDAVDALRILNEMMDDLSTRRLFMPTLPQLLVTWPTGVKEMTIGEGQDIEIARLPVKLWGAQFQWNIGQGQGEQNVPMFIIDEQQYKNIVFQNWRFQWPQYLWFAPSADMDGRGTISIWPLPVRDTLIHIQYQRELLPFPECCTEQDLPAGWVSYLKYEMACRMGPEWTGDDVPASVTRNAQKFAKQIGVITEQKSHVVSGLTAVAPRDNNTRNGGFPQILFGGNMGQRRW